MASTSLEKQLQFLREIDRLKTVVRQSPLLDRSRKENSAEHSWHLALYALVLSEYASGPVDTQRVMRMLLLHDVVEIDVGDFPVHGGSSAAWQAEHEDKAAQRLFGLLPSPQGDEFLALWREFEQAESEDALRQGAGPLPAAADQRVHGRRHLDREWRVARAGAGPLRAGDPARGAEIVGRL